MAFGPAVTCYVPQERRKGGKEPAQRRSFKGVLLGYADNMPAYRIWDLGLSPSKAFPITLRSVTREPTGLLKAWRTLAVFHLIGGVLTTIEWRKFLFDDED